MTYKINELWQGDVFSYGGISWVVISQEEAGGRVLTRNLFGMKPFDDENKDWRSASLKEYMTGELFKQIIDGGADEAAFINAEVDLTAVNGSTDYGKDTCKIAPMTEALYTANKSAIPKVDETYWLVTPYSHEESYIGGAYMHYVRIIRPDGSIDGSAPDGGLYGVRGCCVIAGDTQVDVTASEIDEEIRLILAYDNPIVTIQGVSDLAAGLKTLIRQTAQKCEDIPAVQNGKEAAAEEYRDYTAVTMYQAIRSAAVQGIIARTDITLLYEKMLWNS